MDNLFLQQAWEQLKDIDDNYTTSSLNESLINEANDLVEIEDDKKDIKNIEDENVFELDGDADDYIYQANFKDEDEENVKDYAGQVVLECNICHGITFKNEDEIEFEDDDDEDCNFDDICPYCQSENSGFKVIGQIVPFNSDDNKEDDEEEEDEEDIEKVEESEKDFDVDKEEEQEVDDDFDGDESLSESCDNKKDEGLLGAGAGLAGGGAGAAIGGLIGGPLGALAGGAIGSGLGMAASAPVDKTLDTASDAVSNITKDMDAGDAAGLATMLLASDDKEKECCGNDCLMEADNTQVKASAAADPTSAEYNQTQKQQNTVSNNATDTAEQTNINSVQHGAVAGNNAVASNIKDVGTLSAGNLNQGSDGARVKALQISLRQHGYEVDPDGKFGPQTKQALMQFQKDNGLQVDGVYGQQTAAALSGTVGNQNLDSKAEQKSAEETSKASSNITTRDIINASTNSATANRYKASQQKSGDINNDVAVEGSSEFNPKEINTTSPENNSDFEVAYKKQQEIKQQEEKTKQEQAEQKKKEQAEKIFNANYQDYLSKGLTADQAKENALRDAGLQA